MIRINHYAIRLPTGLRFQKQFSKNIYGSESCHSLSCSFTEIVFSISTTFSASDSLLHNCSKFASCHTLRNDPGTVTIPQYRFNKNKATHTTCSYYYLYQVWQTWAYSLVFGQLACWHIDVSRWSGGQPWRLSPFHRRRHSWCAHMSLPANFSARTAFFSCPFA